MWIIPFVGVGLADMAERQANSQALDFNALIIRVRERRNPMGAAYRLCALTRPATVTELCVNLQARGVALDPELLGKVTDGWLQWRDAGKPPAVHV